MPEPTILKLNLYKLSTEKFDDMKDWPDNFMGYKLIIYEPGLLSRPKYGTSLIRNFLMNVTTFLRYRILFLFDNDVFVHYMEIVPRNYRFRFMKGNDILLQQSLTNPSYRGRGIMTNMMKLVPSVYKKDCKSIWGYCYIENKASIKAIERAGFEFVSYAKMNTLTKIIKLVDKL